jgi:hypothetical protein
MRSTFININLTVVIPIFYLFKKNQKERYYHEKLSRWLVTNFDRCCMRYVETAIFLLNVMLFLGMKEKVKNYQPSS